MQGKNHIALALVIPLGAALIGSQQLLPATVTSWAGLVLGSLAPDLDGGGAIARPSSFLPKLTPRPILIVLDQIGLTISKLVQHGFGHRGGLHWPLWGLLLIAAGKYLSIGWLIWFGIGYLLHIAGDALTVDGVPLLGPIWRQKISLLPMRTGGMVESFLGAALWGLAGVGLVIHYLPGQYGLAHNLIQVFLDQAMYRLSLQ